MMHIFEADQKARQNAQNINWDVVGKEDQQRRERTQVLLDAGSLKTGNDFFHAAFVFQHGGKPDDYLKAHLLATLAVARGAPEARWIAAATLDRYLQSIGQPQVLGTQYKVDAGGKATQEPFNRSLLPDALRASFDVPGLAEQEERRQALEADAAARVGETPRPPLKGTATAPVPRKFSDDFRPVDCPAIPGAEQVLNRPQLHWIVLGEIHGTNETSAAFADFVCLASRRHPVTVAVEQSTDAQRAIDTFIGSDGGEEATSRFLQSPMWNLTMKDGRSSEAYFQLFQRLRELRAAGHVSSVVAFQPVYTPGPSGFDPAEYENAMAATLLRSTESQDLTLVLVGNMHAQRIPVSWAKPPYRPMAGYLPPEKTVTLNVRWNGGQYWACTSATECGTQSMVPPPVVSDRQISIEGSSDGAYSGVFNLGIPSTASPPVEGFDPSEEQF